MKPNLPAFSTERNVQGGAAFLAAFQIKNKHVLVIGGGKEASTRTFFALDADALVTVISPVLSHPAVKMRHEHGQVEWIERKFQDSDLERRHEKSTSVWPVDMVLCCIDDHVESERISKLCRSKRIPVNCADIPDLCDFFFMAQYRDKRLQLAISTQGAGPRLSARLRTELLCGMDPYASEALIQVADIREKIKSIDSGNDIGKRMAWISNLCDSLTWRELSELRSDPEAVLNAFQSGKNYSVGKFRPSSSWLYLYCPHHYGPIQVVKTIVGQTVSFCNSLLNLVYGHFYMVCQRVGWTKKSNGVPSNNTVGITPKKYNDDPRSEKRFTEKRFTEKRFTEKRGKLYLVGAGPGSPDMLTIAASKLINACDLVVSDRLIPQSILNLIDPEKLILSSFKVGGKSDEAQDQSNQICLNAIREGKTVVRLKTGDPFVYGRGGEEILFFRKHGYNPSVIPGISSVFAGPTSALIPITHRDVADQVLLLSGRGKDGIFPQIPDYVEFRTTIFLMSLSRIKELVDLMLSKGYPSDTSCAVIQRATWTDEKTVFSTLEDIVQQLSFEKMANPSMMVVGNVCNLLH